MTKEQLAALLDGQAIELVLTDDIEALAREYNLVIIFGASDDLVELRGAIDDELTVYPYGESESIYISTDGAADQPFYGSHEIKAFYARPGAEADWTYETELPHSTFRVMDDGELYSIGVVIDLNELDA